MLFNDKNQKSRWITIIKVVVAIGAFLFIALKISHQVQKGQLFNLGEIKPGYLIASVVLVVFNWLLESVKWKYLTKPFEELTLLSSVRSILSGLTISLFTPNRVGEFAGRIAGLLPRNRLSGTMATWIGSYSQIIAILFFGTLAALLLPLPNLWLNKHQLLIIICLAVILIVSLAGYLFIGKWIGSFRLKRFEKLTPLVQTTKMYSKGLLTKVFMLSILRYLVYTTQYYLVLCFTGISIGILPAFCSIAFIYVVLTAIPTIALAELGIRGSVALAVLSPLVPYPVQILAATILIWIINLGVPSLIGAFSLYRTRIE
jgi:uncharacterized membrane protein YbhN (UPF0104 family)